MSEGRVELGECRGYECFRGNTFCRHEMSPEVILPPKYESCCLGRYQSVPGGATRQSIRNAIRGCLFVQTVENKGVFNVGIPFLWKIQDARLEEAVGWIELVEHSGAMKYRISIDAGA